MAALIYDYYEIDVPGDCAGEIGELAEIAINEARERARIYAVPAEWTAKRVSGELGDFNVKFKVTRKRRKPR